MRYFSRVSWAGAIAIMLLGGVAMRAGAQGGTQSGTDEYQVGDRIALQIEGPLNLADTVVVREGLILRLPNMADISLKGVSRAETQKYLSQEIGKYVKNSVVRATPLIRIAVLGAVAKPGYYSVPTDLILSDVLMQAGGPGQNAAVDRAVLRRDGKEVFDRKAVGQALAQGKTLQELQVRSGDQIYIAEKPASRISTTLQVTGALVGLAGLVTALALR